MGLILVASEDSGTKETIKAALSVRGWWVTAVGDRETALQVAADQAPELVIVDSALPEALELIRSFGSSNGGPGALVCAPDGDLQDSLGLHEAGADEVLTKPVGAAEVLQAVERSLSTPRAQPAERPVRAKELLTSEEIFGDVLKELEDLDEPPEAGTQAGGKPEPRPLQPAALTLEPPAPAVEAEAAVGGYEPQLDQESGDERFYLPSELDEPEVPAPAIAAEAESSGQPVPWMYEEDETEPLPVDEGAEELAPPAVTAPTVQEPPAEAATAGASDAVPERQQAAQASYPYAVPAAEENAEEEDDSFPATVSSRERRWRPIAGAAIAAALLLVLGILLVQRSGGEPAEPPVEEPVAVRVGEPDGPGEPDRVSEPMAPRSEASPSVGTEAALAGEPAPLAREDEPPVEEPVAESSPDVDVGAIVDQELRRREAALREVFLEEERRLQRELRQLETGEEPPSEEDGDDGGSGGDG